MANILIVEDEKNMQDIIAKFMRKGGHNCFTADDGVDALVVLKNQAVDLMILDVMIPHLDGFSVCRTARQMSSLPIIMLTAKSSDDAINIPNWFPSAGYFLFGMFIALLIMMLGLNCYVMCIHISEENRADTKYEYMYTYKYPEQQVPEGGEASFAKSLNKEI